MEDDRRYPCSLQGLLRFCTENTKSEDAPNQSTFEPMSEERLNWLKEAMESLAANDPVKQMLKDVEILLKDQENDVDTREMALKDIQTLCEDLDLANDFHKIGGFQILPTLLRSEHDGLRWGTADLVGTLVQNNPYCQAEMLKINILPSLLQHLDDPTETSEVRIKCLYAISCLTRESIAAQDELIKLNGFNFLLRAMQTNIEKLQIKSAFMIGCLCKEQAKFKDILCDMGMVEEFVSLLHKEHKSSFHEHLAMALLTLVEDNERARSECRRPEFNFRELLEQRKILLTGREECQEELAFINQLYASCFPDNQSGKKRLHNLIRVGCTSTGTPERKKGKGGRKFQKGTL